MIDSRQGKSDEEQKALQIQQTAGHQNPVLAPEPSRGSKAKGAKTPAAQEGGRVGISGEKLIQEQVKGG